MPEPHYTRSETATTSSAMDMIVLLDNPDSLVPFLHWMRDFIPWLDSELTVNGHGINSSCRNHFLLVGLDSNIYTRLLSSDKKIRTYPIEQFIAEFEAFEQGIPNNGLPDLRPDNYLAIPEVLQRVKLRDSKIKCLVSRAMIYATNSSQSSNDTSISVTRSKLHAQLRGTSTAFHTFSYRYNFCVSSNFSNIGHTSNTVFVNSHDGNCYHSMPNTTQFSDDVLENWLSHLALNVGGSAWDISPLCHLSATSCAFRDVIFQQMTKMLSSCFNCQCPISGQAICTPSNYTEDECKCAARGGNVSNMTILFFQAYRLFHSAHHQVNHNMHVDAETFIHMLYFKDYSSCHFIKIMVCQMFLATDSLISRNSEQNTPLKSSPFTVVYDTRRDAHVM